MGHRLAGERARNARHRPHGAPTPSNLYLQCILRLANESGPGMLQTRRFGAAICVQRFDDSLNPAIHITYRVSRRSSSLREPRDPSLKGRFCSILLFMAQAVAARVGVGQPKNRRGGADQQSHPLPGAVVLQRPAGGCVWHTNVQYALVLFCYTSSVNDPSAGSPTETLLRLLLPRNVQI